MNNIHLVITGEKLLKLLDGIIASGKQLFAPQKKKEQIFFAPVSNSSEIVFDYIQTDESPKSVLFPKVELLLSYEVKAKEVDITDHSEGKSISPIILFGSRTCDAAALMGMADFFKSDTPDVFTEKRSDALTVICISCTKSDEYCFCTSVGIKPNDTKGSDILLTFIEDNQYYVEVVSEKGKRLVSSFEKYFDKTALVETDKYSAKLEKVFSHAEITQRLAKSFNHPIWNEASLRCLGCGACAYVCPMCTCFSVEDEGWGKKGDRLRCWDSCGFSLFTLHTSGHNPRPTQSERWRQRVMHKFSYIPEQSNLLGCVGCGRCSRGCPADMNLKESLQEILTQIDISQL
jgi:ferredoxin